ncbi:MAG TPA: hypothetical protein VNQ79_19085 [Blastocatellia bacterium]|nr:hypothetical protein [Blastocatellia bacterium]
MQNTIWKAEQTILAYGVRIGIRTNRPELLDHFPDYLPPLWKPGSAAVVDRLFSLKVGNSALELFEDFERAVRSRSLKTVLQAFETRLKMYVAEMARRRVFVHAGVVGWQGRAIVIPGRSFSGKTSLVAALVRAGAVYYSDEYAVLDLQGRVHPYPQPLAIRQPDNFRQKKCPVAEVGGVTGTRPLPVGTVIVSSYKAGTRWRPREISAGQGVLELLANTVPARRKPEVVMPTLQRAVSTAVILKGARGEASEVASLILSNAESENFRQVG